MSHEGPSLDVPDSSKKRRLSNFEDCRDEDIDVNGDGSELLPTVRPFQPIHLLSDPWIRAGTTTQMITLVICVPSGTRSFHTRVVDDGQFLELKVDWPGPMVDIQWMHKKWLQEKKSMDGTTSYAPSMQSYHPKILALESALKKYRDHSSAAVKSYARFRLPFSVQPTLEKHTLGFQDSGAELIQLDMTAFVENYDIKNDTATFDKI